MLTKEQITHALEGVMDPELRRNIVELGMVRDVAIEEDNVNLEIALTTLACPLQERIVNDIKAAILKLDSNANVNVTLSEMTEEERQRIFKQAQAEQEENKLPPAAHLNNINQIIAVMSGKGGVGKSSVAAMLAVALRRRGQRVGILDADITGPSIPKMFNIEKMPQASPLGIVPANSKTKIKIMSINLLLPDEGDAVVWRGPLLSGAIQQFWRDVFWADLDTLVVDLPPGTSDAALTVLQSLPVNGVLLVTSPQGLAGMVVRKAAQMAQKMDVPILGLVENMSYLPTDDGKRIEVFGPSHAKEIALQINAPLLGELPLDPEMAKKCDAGQIEEYAGELFEPIVDGVLREIPTR